MFATATFTGADQPSHNPVLPSMSSDRFVTMVSINPVVPLGPKTCSDKFDTKPESSCSSDKMVGMNPPVPVSFTNNEATFVFNGSTKFNSTL